jgi:hypothetical protein
MEQTLEQRLEALERQVQRQADYVAIANVMGRYQYLHTAGRMDLIGKELFAYDHPDARSEYGPLGVFGPEKSLEFFEVMTARGSHGTGEIDPGRLELHQITTPVIEVAEDGQTAKAMWMSTGAIFIYSGAADEDRQTSLWDSGKYAVDFIKQDGVWKIWHLHVCDLWRSDYDTNPVKNAGAAPTGTTQAMVDDYKARVAAGEDVRPGGMPCPDGPTTTCYAYARDSRANEGPKPPEPYRTFSETFAY